MGANQFTKKVNTGNKGAYSDKDGSVLTPRQQRFFVNLALDRFPTMKQCAIDAGYSATSAKTGCVTLAHEYKDYIEGLRLTYWTDETVEEGKRNIRLAKQVLKDLALHSANDNVRRLASRDLLELAGELRDKSGDRSVDLTPRDLRQEAQRVAQGLISQTMPTNTVN